MVSVMDEPAPPAAYAALKHLGGDTGGCAVQQHRSRTMPGHRGKRDGKLPDIYQQYVELTLKGRARSLPRHRLEFPGADAARPAGRRMLAIFGGVNQHIVALQVRYAIQGRPVSCYLDAMPQKRGKDTKRFGLLHWVPNRKLDARGRHDMPAEQSTILWKVKRFCTLVRNFKLRNYKRPGK